MNQFTNILYVNEPSVEQAATLAHTVSLAEKNLARLTIADVVPATTDVADRQDALEALLQPYKGRLLIQTEALVGRPFAEVIGAVLKGGYDLVIKPAENPSWTDRLFGSDDLQLLRKCPCPVWLMKSPVLSNHTSIIAALDFNPLHPSPIEQALNRDILALAGALALSSKTTLHIVHAWESFAEATLRSRSDATTESLDGYAGMTYAQHKKGLTMLTDEFRQKIGKDAYAALAPRLHLLQGEVKKTIASLATTVDADLVILGTVARTGLFGLIFGNTAEALLDELPCSVLAIKPQGFKAEE